MQKRKYGKNSLRKSGELGESKPIIIKIKERKKKTEMAKKFFV